MLTETRTEVEVEALPASIPHQIDVDVSGLVHPGDAIRVGDLNLPQGVTAVTAEDETIVQVEAVYQEPKEAAEEAAEAAPEESAGEESTGAERTNSLNWAGTSGSQPDANQIPCKKTRAGHLSDPLPWHHGSRALAASGLHRDALGTVTTMGITSFTLNGLGVDAAASGVSGA